jgi:hypothetical protein
MTSLTRALVPVFLLGVALTAGCSGSSSSPASGPASSGSTASVVPSSVVPPSFSAAPVTPVSPEAGGGGATSAGNPGSTEPAVLFAEGGDIRGTVGFKPSCAAGCPLSGDGTTQLAQMTWPTWNATEAVGRGTEKIDGCDPNCAAGTLYSVKVTVTFSNPVQACVSGNSEWFWTRASFDWPDGLPSVFSGGNAPVNPVNWSQITGQPCS